MYTYNYDAMLEYRSIFPRFFPPSVWKSERFAIAIRSVGKHLDEVLNLSMRFIKIDSIDTSIFVRLNIVMAQTFGMFNPLTFPNDTELRSWDTCIKYTVHKN